MNSRACCIALVLGAGIASPYGSGQSNAQERRSPAIADREVVLAAGADWSAPSWEYSDQLIDPALRESQHRSRNPAGRLVLPAPRTSHAPAF